ncbi:class I adenylate cyclase [Aestuariirhabdus litorea]|uniref:Adenylate cyclase n=1 Tax=Aestuariirhabdus litorea TaxID=2528527 RepID=A0A3P3VMK8_9GAMM|nr:class I adenylate cyclase [Aestuariirhabdus litorea]RRJ82959.1 adenylate cyclase [Aestuariirhabdus litorea]RWW93118.1 class I adenylate cyclase [Endozoicomonadaceae bacterium GTF-13]
MSQHQALIHSLEGGVDRKTLKRIQQRFMEINQGRLLRARAALATRQQLFLDLLPLLFMENHPLLPGFVSYQTPAGISRYEPDKSVLDEAHRLTRSFRYRRKPGRPCRIYSLFLMGSCGSLAHSGRSDLDIWVCHAPDLSERERVELQHKCTLLEKWAQPFNLEVHFFLMDDEKFRNRQHQSELSGDDCGSSQHSLLLDEFYRTALLLAGRYPIWWLIPPGDEAQYDHFAGRLREQRYIAADETVDFGGITEIPAGEFVGAGLWQMFKGLESPFKSVLKLMLTELYASRSDELISMTFKRRVYQGEESLDALDPYILLYRKLETYLSNKAQWQRLELVRKALYFKVGKRLSQRPRRSRSWQRGVMEQLTQDWQWDPDTLADLDRHHQWKVDRVANERAILVSQLMHSYRFLSQYSRDADSGTLISQRDMQLLGRRLYAAFERRANKLPRINPGISGDMAESNLTLVYREGQIAEWQLFRGALKHHELDLQPPLKQAPSLVSLLGWCHFNKVIDSSTHLSLFPGNSALTEHELQLLLQALKKHLPVFYAPMDDDTYLQPSRPSRVLMLVNVGTDPMADSSRRNFHLLSNRTDSLGFSALRANHVLTIDQLSVNSWNEWTTTRFEGPEALLHCLREYLSQCDSTEPPELVIRCYCRNRAQQIQDRVNELFADIGRHLLGNQSAPSRYILQVEHHFHVLQQLPQTTLRSLENEAALIEFLGQPQPLFSPILVDRYALRDSLLSLLLGRNEAGRIQLFYQPPSDRNPIQLYLLDERGSLLHQTIHHHDLQPVLVQIYRFLQRVIFRLNAHPEHPEGVLTSDSIEFYEIDARSDFVARQLRRVTPPQQSDRPYLEVQVIIELDSEEAERLSIFCDEREFSPFAYDEQQLEAAAEYIVQQRQGRERYPCYITDVDLPLQAGEQPLQSIHYLQRKWEIEALLDQAQQQGR